jgi:thioesterase domain-containing protein
LNYCPKPYEGSVVLFRSLERTFGFAHDLRLGWGQMLGDKLEICQVPGNHYTIYMEPNVNGLAHEMTVRLKMAVDRVAKSLSAAGAPS